MGVRMEELSVTTLADGSFTETTEKVLGKLEAIEYIKTDFDNGVVFLFTNVETGEILWSETAVNASVIIYPRRRLQNTLGANLTVAEVTEPVLYGAKIQALITSGGNVKTGRLKFYYWE